MARATLLPYFAAQAPIVVDPGNAANWVNSGSNGTFAFSNVNFNPIDPPTGVVPSAGMQVSQNITGSQTNLLRTFGVALDLSLATYIDVLIYWPNPPVNNNPSLFLDSTGSNFTNYFLVTLNGALTGTQKRGWNVYRILKSAFSVGAGAPVFSNITRLQFRLTATNGPDTLILGQITAAGRSRPKVILQLDDGSISQFAAAQQANTLGIKVSVGIVPALSIVGGGVTYISAAQFQTLAAAGNTIQTHGWDHTSYINQPDGGAADLVRVRNFLVSNNLGPTLNPGFYHHMWVQGDSNGATYAAIAAQNTLSARGTRSTTYQQSPERYEQTASWDLQNQSFGLIDAYSFNCPNLNNTSYSDVTALAAVDNAIKFGSTVFFYAHVIGAGAADFSAASWTALITGIQTRVNQGLIDAITQDQYYTLMSSNLRAPIR